MKRPQQPVRNLDALSDNVEALAVLKAMGFPSFRNVDEAGRLASSLPPSWKCGIYVFECENGDVYVGQTRGPLSTRLSSHRRVVPGIRAVTFARAAAASLNTRERDVHDSLQRVGVRMSNVTFARLEAGPSARFADVMSEDEQRAWLLNPEFIMDTDERPAADQRSTRMQRDYDRFCEHPAASWMLRAMSRYIWRTIPVPRATERTYWGVTLHFASDGVVQLRLNVGAQTTLDLYGDRAWATTVRIYTPRERFERAFGFTLPVRSTQSADDGIGIDFVEERAFASLRALPSSMVEAGMDQYSVDGQLEPMMGLLEREGWIREARAMQLDMMQRRKGINGRSHNAFVADEFLESDPMELLGASSSADTEAGNILRALAASPIE